MTWPVSFFVSVMVICLTAIIICAIIGLVIMPQSYENSNDEER